MNNMLPQQMSYGPANAPGSLYSLQSLPMSMHFPQNGYNNHQFLSQPFPDTALQGSDPNSLEVFKQNIHLVQELVARVDDLARNALVGIENAYHAGTSSLQTIADINALHQGLQSLMSVMRHSGVGALPLLTSETSTMPTEEQLVADASQGIQVLYERHKRVQESAAVVANLLGSNEQSLRR